MKAAAAALEDTPAGVVARKAVRSVLVLGLGNDLLCDDAIGLRVAREVRRQLESSSEIEVAETEEMGLCLLDFIEGYRGLVLVDSIQQGAAPPGRVHEICADDLPRFAPSSPHFLGVGETLALGRELGLAMPERVRILAVEVSEPYLLSTEMTPALEESVPDVARRVLAAARELVRTGSPQPRL